MALPLSTRWFMSIEQTLAKHMHFLANGIESDALIKKYTDFLCQAFVKVPAAHRKFLLLLFERVITAESELPNFNKSEDNSKTSSTLVINESTSTLDQEIHKDLLELLAQQNVAHQKSLASMECELESEKKLRAEEKVFNTEVKANAPHEAKKLLYWPGTAYNLELQQPCFKDAHLGDDGAAELADALLNNSLITKLDLSNNQIGDLGASSIAKALWFNSTLTIVDLSENQFGEAGAASLAEALRFNSSITELELHSNRIGNRGVALLVDSLSVAGNVTYLGLGYNLIGIEGVASLAKMIDSNDPLESLWLPGNNFGDMGAVLLADALRGKSKLASIVLNDCQIKQAASLVKFVCISSITTIQLGGEQMSETDFASLAEALHANSSVTDLSLTDMNFGLVGAIVLSCAFQDNTTLISLDLSYNMLGDAGAASLIPTLRKIKSIETLDLSCNGISEAFCDSIRKLLSDVADVKLVDDEDEE